MKPLIALVGLFLSACVNTNYHAWEGGAVTAGEGGAKDVVDGMDVWVTGKPSRKHKVVGYIEDERGAGIIPRRALYGDLVKVAKEKGGDAVVLLSSDTQVSGISQGQATYNTFTNTLTPGTTTVHKSMSTKALVIKYVD